jgi:tetratricopeptide (TPR) repeat protein
MSKVDELLTLAAELRYKDAVKCLKISREAITLAEAMNYRAALAKAHYSAGVCCRLSSQFENAFTHFDSALSIYRLNQDKRGESRILNSIANVYLSLGNFNKAINYFDECIFLVQSFGDFAFEATVLSNKALACQQAGILVESLENNLQSLSIYKCMKKPVPHTLLNNIGVVYLEIGNYYVALKYFNDALRTEENNGNLSDESSTIANIGRTYIYMENCSAAITFLSVALHKIKQFGNKQSESQIYSNLGKAYHKLGCYPESIDFFNKALTCYREIDDQSSVSHTLAELGELYMHLNDFTAGKKYLEEGLNIALENEDEVNEVKNYTGLAALHLKFGEIEIADEFISKAVKLAEERKSYKELSRIFKLLSDGYLSIGNTAESMKNLKLHFEYSKKLIEIDEENSLRVFTASHKFISSEDYSSTKYLKNKTLSEDIVKSTMEQIKQAQG